MNFLKVEVLQIEQKKNKITTLRPDRLVSTNQLILDPLGGVVRQVHIEGYTDDSTTKPIGRLRLVYFTRPLNERPKERFPPDTRGVFITLKTRKYDSGFAKVWMTLHGEQTCSVLTVFSGTSRLHEWWRTPSDMEQYLLKNKASVQIDPSRDRRRVISTFSPERLMSSSHRIVDISGHRLITVGSAEGLASLGRNNTRKTDRKGPVLFPPDTKGVFYYHQSKTSPTHVGELRFRLYSDSRAFEEGDDLCLPLGDPWHISSHSLSTSKVYRGISGHLIKERLLI
jgi:hypothetical protein